MIVGSRWRESALVAVSVLVAGVAGPPAAQPRLASQATASPTIPTLTAGPRTTGTSAISGIVADEVTGRPIAGAVVSLSNLDKNVQAGQRVLTDTQGRFVFQRLPASADYYLGAERFGYAYTRFGWTSPGQSLTIADIARVGVADGQWVANLRIPLWRLGGISGRVVDERDEPVVGVAVRAFVEARVAGNVQWVAGPLTSTDDRGAYRLSGLSPGRYVVSVLSVQSTVLSTTPDGQEMRPFGALATGGVGVGREADVSVPTVDVDGRYRLALTNYAPPPPPDAGQSRAYPATFFPGVREMSNAQALEIDFGVHRSGVDLRLEPVAAHRIAGRVEMPAGSAPPRLLRLMPVGSERLGFGSEAATTLIESNGTFTFLNVPDGRYTILAQSAVMDFAAGGPQVRLFDAPGFSGSGVGVGSVPGAPGLSYLRRAGDGSPLWARTSAIVGGADLTDVLVTLRPGVRISGRIAFAEGTPPLPVDVPVELLAEPADGDPLLAGRSTYTTKGDTSFRFVIDGLRGGVYLLRNYAATGTAQRTYSLASVTVDGRDVTDTGLDTSAGADLTDVVVTLTDKRVSLTGLVRDSRGDAAAVVILFPVEPVQWSNFGWRPTRIRSARSGPGGAFAMEGLMAGEYFVIAVRDVHPSVWMTPEFFARASGLATRIVLKWGDTRHADVPLALVPLK